MFEPHFAVHDEANDSRNKHFDDHHESSSLLAELDKIAPIKSFDAFPKVRERAGARGVASDCG
jgi:hypothetical protein